LCPQKKTSADAKISVEADELSVPKDVELKWTSRGGTSGLDGAPVAETSNF